MGSVKITAYQDARRKKESGLYPIFLRVYHDTKARIYQIKEKGVPVYVTVEQFESAYNTTKPKPKHQELHDLLISHISYAKDIVKQLKTFSFDDFERVLHRGEGNKESVPYHYKQYIDKLKDQDRINTADSYNLSLKSFQLFTKDLKKLPEDTKTEEVKLYFSDITPEYLEKYQMWMYKANKSNTTVGFYCRALRTIFNNAIASNDIDKETYPFGARKFVIPAGKKVKKALDTDILGKLYHHPVEPGSDMEKARDFWFFSYQHNGINIADILRLKFSNIDGDKLIFYRTKTIRTTKDNAKPIIIPLSQPGRDLIKKYGNAYLSPHGYLFPIINDSMTPEKQVRAVKAFTRYINQHLKNIAKAAGITTDISTYWARHSFATVAIRKGASIEFVSEGLGHKDVATTQNYMAGFEDNAKRAMSDLLMDFTKPVSDEKK